MSSMVAVARRLLLVRILLAETMLFELALGMDSTDIRSAWLASFLRRVLWRLMIVEVSGFKYEPTSDAGAPGTYPPSSEMVVIVSEAGTCDDRADCEAIVERRLPVEGNIRGPKSCRVRRGLGMALSTGASANEEGAEEAVSKSVTSSLGMSSIDVASRRGEDMDRPLVGEYWPRFAPRRFREGVGVTDSSLSWSWVVVSVVASETTVDGVSSRFWVLMVMSRLDRLLRRLLPLPLLRRRSCSTGSSCVASVDVLISDCSTL
jgi:hypothetical protein